MLNENFHVTLNKLRNIQFDILKNKTSYLKFSHFFVIFVFDEHQNQVFFK